MRPCQKQHFLRKIDSYQESIDKCTINIEDQRKRINCFQGLINQLRAVVEDAENGKAQSDN